jgi:hypothetical protein
MELSFQNFVEVFQIAYIVLTAIIIVKESKGARISSKEKIR